MSEKFQEEGEKQVKFLESSKYLRGSEGLIIRAS
jgi:hypothetical protein